jgi:molybdate transport system substrate-binding protein
MVGLPTYALPMALLSVFVGTAAETALAETLAIGAAHSLQAPLQEIVPMFEKEYGATVRVVYGPSQTLRQQIEKGFPIDVFLPESIDEVVKLERKGLTLNGGPRAFAETSLVLVMATASPATAVSFHDVLPDTGIRIAVADPKTSALGEITARTLKKLDPAHKQRAHLLYAKHSDDVMNLLGAGKAEVGIVYRVDAINGGQVRIIDETPGGKLTPVRFGQAVVWTCRDASRGIAEEFFDFILSPRVQKLLLKYGFDPMPSTGEPAENHDE